MSTEIEPPDAPPAEVVPAGPATRRLARELGIDLALVPRSGGRVTPDDLMAYAKGLASAPGSSSHPPVPPLPDFSQWGVIERQPLDVSQRKQAQDTTLAWSLIPHGTCQNEADISELEAMQEKLVSGSSPMTTTACVIKATVNALIQYPRFNASLDIGKNQLILKKYYHIGVVLDAQGEPGRALQHNIDKKSVPEIAQELRAAGERQTKISAGNAGSVTFSVMSVGGTSVSPVIDYPQVAILGVGQRRGNNEPKRWLLPLSLSYDQRIIDSALAAQFMRAIVESLQNPLIMLVQG